MGKKKLVVIGGGGAGFFCAINAAVFNPGLEIFIIEKTTKLFCFWFGGNYTKLFEFESATRTQPL